MCSYPNTCAGAFALKLYYTQLHELVDLGRWSREQFQERRIEHGNILRAEERIEYGQQKLSNQMAWQNSAVARLVRRVDVSTGFFIMKDPVTRPDASITATRVEWGINVSGEATPILLTALVVIPPDVRMGFRLPIVHLPRLHPISR